MRGSTNAPGASFFDLSEAIEGLAKQIMQGTVTTPLETAGGERLCSTSGAVIEARQVQQQGRGAGVPDEVPPIVRNAIEAAVEASERRVVDSIMGALMAGRISATLADRSGTALSTRRGETIAAHQRIFNAAPHDQSQTAGLFPLFERMTANNIAAR